MKYIYLAPLFLTACMSLSPDAQMGSVSSFSQSQFKQDAVKVTSEAQFQSRAKTVESLLKKPLTLNRAICIALLNNSALQAAFADLGVSEAQLVQAVMPINPTLSFGQISNNAMLEIERTILVNVLSLLTLPKRQDIAEIKLEQAKTKAYLAIMAKAQETRRAYFEVLYTKETMKHWAESQRVAKTLSMLIKRLGESGAANKLQQAREHVFYAEVSGQAGSARLSHQANLEKLTRVLGLFEARQFNMASQLPPLPKTIKNTELLERDALKNRLDLKILKLDIEALAKQYGLVEATKFISVLEIKGIHIRDKEYDNTVVPREGSVVKRAGFDLELSIPLYDFGVVKSREAEQNYMKAVHLYLEKTVQVRSESRELHGRLQATHQLARHYENNVLPLREIIKEENLLRYNAMIIDVLVLVNDEKSRIQSLMSASSAKRDYFNAEGDLTAVIYGGGLLSTIETSAAPKQEEKGH